MTPRKINAIQWSPMKLKWNMKLMISAYIGAERQIINDASQGIDTTGHIAEAEVFYTSNSSSPEEFWSMEFEKPKTYKEQLLDKAREVRKQLDEAIDNDDYEKAELLQKTLNVIEKKYNNL